jgi:hypothetical protein
MVRSRLSMFSLRNKIDDEELYVLAIILFT